MTTETSEPTASGGTMVTSVKTDSYIGGEQKTEKQFDADGNYMNRVTTHGSGTASPVVNDNSDENIGASMKQWTEGTEGL